MEKLTVQRGKTAVLLKYDGEMTLEVIPELKRNLDAELAADKVAAVILDLSCVDFMDSSGIGFLVSVNTRMRSAGKDLYLSRLSSNARKTLNLVQLLTYFKVIETDQDLAALLS